MDEQGAQNVLGVLTHGSATRRCELTQVLQRRCGMSVLDAGKRRQPLLLRLNRRPSLALAATLFLDVFGRPAHSLEYMEMDRCFSHAPAVLRNFSHFLTCASVEADLTWQTWPGRPGLATRIARAFPALLACTTADWSGTQSAEDSETVSKDVLRLPPMVVVPNRCIGCSDDSSQLFQLIFLLARQVCIMLRTVGGNVSGSTRVGILFVSASM